MRLIYRVAVLVAVLVLTDTAQTQEKPVAGNRLAALERFVGEWEVNGKWSSGESLRARSVYEWGLGKKILKGQTFVRDGAREYQRYEAVFAWHPQKKCLYEVSFGFDGSLTEVVIESKDQDTLHIGWTPYSPEKPAPIRQVIRFLDQDHFQWTVSLREGEGWKQLIDATWKRKAK